MERADADVDAPAALSPPIEAPSAPPAPHLTADTPPDPSSPISSPPDADDALHLRLKTLDERVFDVHARSSMSVRDFRAQVAQATAVPATRQRLIYRGKLLKDGAALAAYDLQDGHTVHLVARPAAAAARGQTEENEPLRRPRVVTRRRQPGQELTGNAWNLAVLREALNGPTGENTGTAAAGATEGNRPLPMLREMLDEMNESPQEAAAGMGLGDLPAHLNRRGETQPVDLEPITQGIMTVRTVLSTALEQEDAQLTEQVEQEARVEEQQTTPSVRRGQRQFFVGQWLDVKDTVNQWLESTVMDIADGKVLIHYHGWPTRWDEWIEFDSDRIASFRTRTLHTQIQQRMSPVPTTRVPSAPRVGDNDVRHMVVDVRNLMREMMPHIDRLAALCEEDLRREQAANQTQQGEAVPLDGSLEQNVGASDQRPSATGETRENEVSEMAHLVAPLFDRFGRLLMDSVRYFDPLLRPELRGTSLRQQERRSTALRHGNGRGAQPRQNSGVSASMEAQDSSLSLRDLIATSPRTASESIQPRRSIDVHIHAIVAPASLSSFASLSRGNSETTSGQVATGASSQNIRRPLSSPPRPLFDFGESSNADGNTIHDDEGDHSRVPLLGSYRHRSHSQARELGQQQRSVTRDLDEFLSDDFFGTSFGHDDDDDSDDDSSISFSHSASSHTMQATYTPPSPSVQVSSPRTPRSEDYPETPSSMIGVIPEIAEAEERARAREAERVATPHESGYRGDIQRVSSDSSASGGSSSSGASAAFPTFLEVMRRTLSGVRNFVHSDTNDRSGEETGQSVELASSFSLPSSASSTSSSPSPDAQQLNENVVARPRGSSGESSIEEDLDEVD